MTVPLLRTSNYACVRPGVVSVLAAILSCMWLAANGAAAPRRVIALDGSWDFQTNGAPARQWKSVEVPSNWETHEGTNFNGIGWYRLKPGPIDVPKNGRVLLHFQAAATEATVFWNGARVGSHLGGWTPFRFDVTGFIASTNEIRVRLDEKVGHNTQGFLPIVQPHFGGIWQSVRLEVVPPVYFDDLQLRATGNPDTKQIEIEVPIRGAAAEGVSIEAKWRRRGSFTARRDLHNDRRRKLLAHDNRRRGHFFWQHQCGLWGRKHRMVKAPEHCSPTFLVRPGFGQRDTIA